MDLLDFVTKQIIAKLRKDQSEDGSWDYPFETGIATDAYMIILLRTLEFHDEEFIQELVERIWSRQKDNGTWKLFADEEGEGNITSTVEAYYALLYSGYIQQTDERLLQAKQFIIKHGGIEKSHLFTKIMLALTGQYKWPPFFPIPVETILLPLSFPINFYDFSVYGRANLAPIMILTSNKYQIKTERSPDLSDLFVTRGDDFFSWRHERSAKEFFQIIENGLKGLIGLPHVLHRMAIKRTKQYMLNHLEADGTFYSYYSSTFLMIFALLSLGYPKNDPVIMRAVNGLKAMRADIHGHSHVQYTTADVWNTSLISYALQQARVKETDLMLQKANDYLLSRQHTKYGDWRLHNPDVQPGGWGFSDINTFNPDVDDTTASLRAISTIRKNNPEIQSSWNRAIRWLYSMQNKDGGWPSFEKNVDKQLSNFIPIQGGKFLLNDASSADLTGRTLEFFGNYTKISKLPAAMKRGIQWLLNNQEKDGSWYGRWGICYLYGTWAAITGLKAVGVSNHPALQKAVQWLKSVQNEDGGWGESCRSDIQNTYIPLGKSHLTQTAWALDALIAASEENTPEIEKGIAYILEHWNRKDWDETYPVGQGMGGGFYIHYHSYQYIYPLLALSHFKQKFNNS
ncbi:squalene--hopene cyclase [Cytobacillus sp. Hz8]|uniref:squalene--hopene cyclase n=1 Tax=Cytobacillus sp. Hz8 TaxID=3347168 RepID=UPI0035D725F5